MDRYRNCIHNIANSLGIKLVHYKHFVHLNVVCKVM